MAKITKEEVQAFSLQEEIKKLEDNPRREMNILAWYFESRNPDFRNKAQYQAAIGRHIKAAIALIPFEDDQILNAAVKVKEFLPGWTLDSIFKQLTK